MQRYRYNIFNRTEQTKIELPGRYTKYILARIIYSWVILFINLQILFYFLRHNQLVFIMIVFGNIILYCKRKQSLSFLAIYSYIPCYIYNRNDDDIAVIL